MSHRTARKASIVAGALASLVLGSAPAQAASAVTQDAVEGTQKADLLAVKTTNGSAVRVRMTFDDLRKSGLTYSQGVTVFVDTDADRRGPEYLLTGGLNTGTDYQLLRVRRWQTVGEPMRCSHRLRINWRDDVATVRIGDACFRDHTEVRIGVRVNETHAGTTTTDWLTGRRAFTDPVTQR